MEFETIETLPLECGSLLLQQEVPSARHQVYDPPRLERRVLFSDSRSTTRHLPDLSALRSLVCDMNIRLLQTTYGREATLAEIIVTLVDAIRTTETADDHRWAWVMEETYGIDLDDCVPRVDGTTLRFLGRKEDFRTYLLTFLPLIEVLVDLTTLQYSTQDMEVWRESARRGPQFRAGNVSFVRVQNRPHIGRPSSFPRSDVMCVENAQEHGVLDLTALPTLAKLSPNAFVHAIRDQQVAFAHIACALSGLRLLTPGWRHAWTAQYVDLDLACDWLRLDDNCFQLLAYPTEDPENDAFPLYPSVFRVSIDLTTMKRTRERVDTSLARPQRQE